MNALRPARITDTEVLGDLERRCFGSEAWSPAAVEEELVADPAYGCVLVAVDGDDEPLGYAALSASGETAELRRIAVHPRHRRRKYGQALLGALIAEAERRACVELLLEVRADNEPALGLYLGNGFESIGARRGYYDLGRVDALVLRRALRPSGVGTGSQ